MEILSSQADLILQGYDTKLFGTGIWHLDFNGDGVIDLAFLEGINTGGLELNRALYIFNGKDLENKTTVDTRAASFKIEFFMLGRTVGLTDEDALAVGDFNGDGCGDFLILNIWRNTLDRRLGLYLYPTSIYLILGSRDCFDQAKAVQKSPGPAKFYISSRDKMINYHISSVEVDDPGFHNMDQARVSVSLFDLNGDQRDDICISYDLADAVDKSMAREQEGKVAVVFGKETPPERLDLSKDADIVLFGDGRRAHLGRIFFPCPNMSAFVAGLGKFYYLPDLSKIAGSHVISQIPGVTTYSSWLEGLFSLDMNGDSKQDIAIIARYRSDIIDEFKQSDPARYQKFKSDNKFPLLSIIYVREEAPEAGKSVDELSDIVIYSRIEKKPCYVEMKGLFDLDQNGKMDIIVSKSQEEPSQESYFYLFNFQDKGNRLVIEDNADFSIVLPQKTLYTPPQTIKLNENAKGDFFCAESTWPAPPKSPQEKPKKDCGRIFLFRDKILDKDVISNLAENADLIIRGEQEKEHFGHYARSLDINGDGLEDLVVLSPYKDFTIGALKKNNAGAVYIFLSKSLGKWIR
jgi:hypothetical protein